MWFLIRWDGKKIQNYLRHNRLYIAHNWLLLKIATCKDRKKNSCNEGPRRHLSEMDNFDIRAKNVLCYLKFLTFILFFLFNLRWKLKHVNSMFFFQILHMHVAYVINIPSIYFHSNSTHFTFIAHSTVWIKQYLTEIDEMVNVVRQLLV